MINISCPLCDNDNYTVTSDACLDSINNSFDYLTESPTHYRIVQCNICGMKYSNPILSDIEIIELYKSSCINNCVRVDESASIRINMISYFSRLLSHSSVSKGKFLDIGCGCGHLLKYASERGFEVAGIDPAQNAIIHARQLVEAGDIREGIYTLDSYPENYFDLISCIHVIDHVVDPKLLLKAAYKHLKHGGYMIIATHNMNSLLARVSGKTFIAYSIQHITYFTPSLLKKMAEQCGFSSVTIKRSLSTYTLRHYAENGFRSHKIRKLFLSILTFFRVDSLQLSFPFGNMELIVKK
ncbi:MAG: class I SAM-dependent methyltransferase [Pseudomonadota bacterium]